MTGSAPGVDCIQWDEVVRGHVGHSKGWVRVQYSGALVGGTW